MRKRLLSALLAICMVLTLLPGTALAEWADMTGGTGILGQVLDITTDLPPESVTATLRYDDESGDLFDVTTQCAVDSDGKFQFTYHGGGGAFPAGSYTLIFTSPFYLTETVPIRITGDSGSEIVQKYLTPGGSIFGMVTDAQTGAALAGVSVSARSGGAVKRTTATDEGGNYSLEVEAGEYTIEFSKENYQTATLTRAFGPGTKGHIGADDIQLTPGNDTGGGSGSGSGGDSGEGGDSGDSENNWSWTLEDGVLTVYGTGAMTDYSSGTAPWYSRREEITKAVIQEGITSIGNNAFYNCSNLANVAIPDSITEIGNSAFESCNSLIAAIIPDGVTSINPLTFYGCSSLSDIIIPSSVTSIGNSAFNNCSSLTNVMIPDRVTSIGQEAFHNCKSLTDITIPASTTNIGYSAFSYCSNLYSLIILGNITDIGNSVFSYCSSLSNVLILGDITKISESMFRGCSNLIDMTISGAVTGIDSYAFFDCSRLLNITLPSDIISIGNNAFYGCSSLSSVTIPDSVTSIGNSAFGNCSSLTNITIPGNVISIEAATFFGCNSLISVIICDGIISVGNNAFNACSNLRTITIPNSVTSIEANAFVNIYSLTDVYYSGSEEQWTQISIIGGDYYGGGNWALTSATIHYNSTGPGSGDTSETKPKVTGEATVTLTQNQIFYKDDKLAFPGGDYEGKSSFEIPVTVTITNTTTSSTISQSELQADETLNMTVNSLTVAAPNGFNFGWFGGGSIDLKKPVTLRVGESWTGTGYIRAGTYFDQEADEWTYGIYATAETSIGQLSGYGEFTITKATDADDDLVEDAATELIKLNINDKVAFNAALMSALGLRGDTLEMFKQEVFTEIVMSNIPEKTLVDALKDKITEKVMKKVFSYKEDLSVTQYHLPLKYSFNTSSYGTVILLLDCEITDFSMKGSRYGLTATINYEIVSSKKSLPVTISKSGLLGMVNYADVKTFVESAYSVATAEVKKQYNSVWGNDANKLAKLIFGDTVTKIMKAIDKSYSDIPWKLIIWPAKNVKADCPINVYIYDEDGTLCGAIENDHVTTSSDNFQLSVVGETKYITGMTDDYEIKYVATDDGSMDIEVTENYGDDLVLRLVGFYNVPLHIGGEYSQTITTEFLPVVEVYQLTSENDDVISADTDEILPDSNQDESDSSGSSSGSGNSPGSSSSSNDGGSSSNPSYQITAPTTANGTVIVNPKSAKTGEKVTITAKSDDGYTVGSVTVKDSNGKSVIVTDNGDGTYTFTMPSSQVTISVTFVPVEAPWVNSFTDVSESDWFYDEVAYVAQNGLMQGVGGGKFDPSGTTTRGMIVTILYRLENEPTVSPPTFTDVVAGQYYTKAVAWAAANKIVEGYGNNTFGPNDNITREQMAAILYRYADYKGYDVSGLADLYSYTDLEKISNWALTAMRWANRKGLVTGRTTTTLVPKGTATRAEATVILTRFCQDVAGLE